jgi:hypothetical protein
MFWMLFMMAVSFLVISGAVIALVWGIADAFLGEPERRKQGRVRAGLCAHCGYDLRATPRQCPECGRFSYRGPTYAR